MAVDFAAQLRVLQDAQGQPAKLALATVDLTYPELPDAERVVLKAALEAAAIPHWCDEAILAALLEIPIEESANRLASLRGLTVAEPFPARGEHAINVHEASRLTLRKRVAADNRARFRVLSTRATAYFAADPTKAGRVEWIYHLLCSDPESAANELEKLDRDWASTAHPEDRYALAGALRELENSGVVQGRAQVWAMLVAAWNRVSRGEASQLAHMANHILSLAKSAADLRAEADAQVLLGDALQAQGKLKEAQAAFAAALALNQRLAEQGPTNAAWQRDLAKAHGWVGGVFAAQGKLAEAQSAFAAALAINQRIVDQDPGNARWQRELAVAHNRVGGLFETQGKLTEAQAAFKAALVINQRLGEQDPGNARWQRDLAVAYNRVGGVFEGQGKLTEAQAAFALALAIMQRLTEQDPSNPDWQRGLAVAYNRVGGVFKARGKLTEAQAAFDAALAINQRLTN